MNIDYDIKAEACNIISNRIVNWNDIKFYLITMNIYIYNINIYFKYICVDFIEKYFHWDKI